ncbi:MAG: hypothetical protein V3U75_08875 [Methylococcaceae bacterium]
MKKIVVLLCLLFQLSACSLIKKSERQPVAFVSQGRSINLLTSDDKLIFPEQWLVAPTNAKAQALSDDELKRSRKIILDGMAKYPVNLLFENLQTVYVLKHLEFSGVRAGGTNSLKNVYVLNKGLVKGFTAKWIEKTFHAEFSSILLRNYSARFDRAGWRKINEPDFHYGQGGVNAISTNKARKRFDPALHKTGFLHEYACSSMENDFNAFAELLLLGHSSLWNLAEKYPRIRSKLLKIIQFYQAIHPTFNERYFRSLVSYPELRFLQDDLINSNPFSEANSWSYV